MEMSASVAPSVEVHAPDITKLEDRLLDPPGKRAEARSEPGREIGEGVHVEASGQPHTSGKAGLDPVVENPVIV
jgi:hypothetical protein